MSLRVLHLLDHSWPVLDGYSHRSRSVVSAQADLGIRPSVITGPLHELDDPTASDLRLDGIQYLRTFDGHGIAGRAIRARWPLLRELSVVRLLQQRIVARLASEPVDILHAHSPALCGLAALRVARSHRIPFVYEIRCFWEDSRVDEEGSVRYRLGRGLETYVARRADAIVGIADSLLQDLAGRGIPSARLFHVPNGVDALRFAPQPRDSVLAAQLGVENLPTLGYLGTLFPWEGISWLVPAAVELHKQGVAFKLLIVGEGSDAAAVKKAIQEADAGGYISFLGRVPHDQVERYYSVMDVLLYPRKSVRLTELVTPLKPLEAMAMGKPVLASGVGGLRELIDPEVTGVLFEVGNSADFCRQASRVLKDSDFRRKLGENARQRISLEKDWKVLAQRYGGIYEAAIRNARNRT